MPPKSKWEKFFPHHSQNQKYETPSNHFPKPPDMITPRKNKDIIPARSKEKIITAKGNPRNQQIAPPLQRDRRFTFFFSPPLSIVPTAGMNQGAFLHKLRTPPGHIPTPKQ